MGKKDTKTSQASGSEGGNNKQVIPTGKLVETIKSFQKTKDPTILIKALHLDKKHPVFNGQFNTTTTRNQGTQKTTWTQSIKIFAKLGANNKLEKSNINIKEEKTTFGQHNSTKPISETPSFKFAKKNTQKHFNFPQGTDGLPFKVAKEKEKPKESDIFDKIQYFLKLGFSSLKGIKSFLARLGKIELFSKLFKDYSDPNSKKERHDDNISIALSATIATITTAVAAIRKKLGSGMKQIIKHIPKKFAKVFMNALDKIMFLFQIKEDYEEFSAQKKKGKPISIHKPIRDAIAIAVGVIAALTIAAGAISALTSAPEVVTAAAILGVIGTFFSDLLTIAGNISLLMDLLYETYSKFLKNKNIKDLLIKSLPKIQTNTGTSAIKQKRQPLRQNKFKDSIIKQTDKYKHTSAKAYTTAALIQEKGAKESSTKESGNYDIKSIAETIMKGINDKLRDSVVAYG